MDKNIEAAKEYLALHGTLSTVFLQYKIKIGYKDAEFIMNYLMEKNHE